MFWPEPWCIAKEAKEQRELLEAKTEKPLETED